MCEGNAHEDVDLSINKNSDGFGLKLQTSKEKDFLLPQMYSRSESVLKL